MLLFTLQIMPTIFHIVPEFISWFWQYGGTKDISFSQNILKATHVNKSPGRYLGYIIDPKLNLLEGVVST